MATSTLFADPEMVQLWDEAVRAHREKTAIDLKDKENEKKTKLLVRFWNSLKPAKSTASGSIEAFELDSVPSQPDEKQQRELVDELTREHVQFQNLRDDGGKLSRVRHFLGKYAESMASIGSVAESLLEDPFPPAALVAVAFTHIMTSVAAVTADLDLIENLFEIMTSFAERLGLMRKIPKEKRFRNLLLKTFTHMLEFCTSAHSRLQKDNYRIKSWFKAMFKGQDEKLKEAYDRVVTVIDDMGKATMVQTLATLLDFQDDTERTLQKGFSRMDSGFMKVNSGLSMVLTNQRHESQRNQRRDEETRGFRAEIRKNNDKIINILLEKNGSKSGSEARKVSSLEIITKSLFTGAEYFLAQRWAKMEREFVKDTFAWFDMEYEALKAMDHGVIFISGASGMGKSFFSFAIMSRLAKDFEDVSSISVASFMFDQDNEKLETVRSMLYFCSAQVASSDDSFRQHIQRVVDNLDDTKEDWKANPWTNLFVEKFQKKNAASPSKVYLILDGIDQLEEETELAKLAQIVRDSKEKGLRIIFVISGTPEVAGLKGFSEEIIDKKICLARENMRPDFKLFAKSQIESVQGLSGHRPALKEQIADALRDHADTFFYVTYILRQLDIMRIGPLVERAIKPSALPESTEAIYQQLFRECDQYFPSINEKKALGYLFTWLAYSYNRITLDAAQTLVDLIMVSILGEKQSTLDIRRETMGRLSKILAFSEPLDEGPDINAGDYDNNHGQNGGNGRIKKRNGNAEPEVILTWQQHSLRDYFTKHPEKSISFLQPTKHETSVMMFKMTVAVLSDPTRKPEDKITDGERMLDAIAAHCVFNHLVEAQPLQSDEEVASVAQTLYILLGQSDQALEKIEKEFEFAEESYDATDYCSIFLPSRAIEDVDRKNVLTAVDKVLQALLDLGSKVSKVPGTTQTQVSAEASKWIKTTLESRYSILKSIALGHIRNWFSETTLLPSNAFAAFRFAHVALWTLTEEERERLIDTTGVKFTDEHFPDDLRAYFPDSTFELVATLGRNPLGPRDHRQIAKALQYDLRNKGSKEQAEKGLEDAKDIREIFDLRYRIARAHFDEWVYPEPVYGDTVVREITPESVLQAWDACLKDIPPNDPDGSLKIMLNAAYQMKARVESMIEGHEANALVNMKAAADNSTPESFPRFLEEMVVAFGERGLWHEITELLGYYNKPLTVKCRDMTHRFIQRAAKATGDLKEVRDLYIEAAEKPDESNGADESEVRIWLASFEWFVMPRQDSARIQRAKDQLSLVLKSKQSGFLWSEKAGRKLADILLEEFRMSRQLSYKTDRLAEMEGVVQSLRDRLGLEFKPKLSQTNITLAHMRRKLGPAHTFYQALNDSFEAACEALNDLTETNDIPSLRLLAKVLSFLPDRIEDAQIALSCQFYVLPSRKPPAPIVEVTGTGSIKSPSLPQSTTTPPRRSASPTKRTPSPSKRAGSQKDPRSSHSPSPSRTPSPGLGTPRIPPNTRSSKKKNNRSPSRPAAIGSSISTGSPRPGTPQSGSGGGAVSNIVVAEPTEAELEQYDFNRHTIECAGCNKTISTFSLGGIYMCVYCTGVDLCEECYVRRQRHYARGDSSADTTGLGLGLEGGAGLGLVNIPTGKGINVGGEDDESRKSYVEVCPWGHELIEAPVKGWKGVRGDMLEYGSEDEAVKFQDWLDGLKKRWEQSWRGYWRDVEDEL